jgi:hypothetical protein
MPEQIVIADDTARFDNGHGDAVGLPLQSLVERIRAGGVAGMAEEPLADNVRWSVSSGPLQVLIVELPYQLRRLQWLDDRSPVKYGPQAVYKPRRVALPYVLFKVPLLNGQIVSRVELFYRTQPLTSLNDTLLWSNLLNVSPFSHGVTAWLCTQYLATEPMGRSARQVLNALMHHTWGGGFNQSSEAHEGQSAWGKAQLDKLDRRVADINLWEQNSLKKPPEFVLTEIAWKPVENLTIRDLIHQELAFHRQPQRIDDVEALSNVLLAG